MEVSWREFDRASANMYVSRNRVSTFPFIANAIPSRLYDGIGKIACLRIFRRFQRSRRGKPHGCYLTFIAPSAVDDGDDSRNTRWKR